MVTVTKVAKSLQRVFTEQARQLGRSCGVIQRQRVLDGASLAQGLVFGWLNNPQATLDELAQAVAVCGAPVYAQAIDQRFNARTVEFFLRLFQAGMKEVITAEPVTLELLQRFSGVYLQDSTVISLPDACRDQWPGCGGSRGQTRAALKAQVRLELTTGRLFSLLEAGRCPDVRSQLQQQALPPGSLLVADLGYFDLAHLRRLDEQGVYFISRIQVHTAVFDEQGHALKVRKFLRRIPGPVERRIQLGVEQRLPCRLMAVPVPNHVVRRRRKRLSQEAKRRGRPVSQRQLDWCRWTVLVTNAPPEKLSIADGLVLAKARWQNELLFKLWKSIGQLDESRSMKTERILTELFAKLLGLIVQHWLLLITVWKYPDRSLYKAARRLQSHMLAIARLLSGTPAALQKILCSLEPCLRNARIHRRRKRPALIQLLKNPASVLT
jgi:Transposase DDE domain